MLKVIQYPRNADGTPMDLEVGVLTDDTGNNGTRLSTPPIGPDGAPIDAKALILVDKDGNLLPIARAGAAMRIGLFAALAAVSVPGGTNIVETGGYSAPGIGGARYVYSAAVDAAYVAANPRTSAITLNGRGFRIETSEGVSLLQTGGVPDCAAANTGTDNTPAFEAARAALIADGGGKLLIPQRAAAYRMASAPSPIHDGIKIVGDNWYTNPGTVGVVSYIGIQQYYGSVLCFDTDVAGFNFVAFTDNASNNLAYEYQSSTQSSVENLMLYSPGGVGTTAHGIVHYGVLNLTNVRVEGFAGYGVKTSGDDSGTANQYGNAALTFFRNVSCRLNKLSGFYVEGNNSSVISYIGCDSALNGGVGFLDKGPFGNWYGGCHAATNNASFGTPAGYSAAQRAKNVADYAPLATQNNGSFVCTGGVASSTYTACYVEPGIGSNPDIGVASVVNGGQLANWVWQFNVGTNGNPTINSARGVDAPFVNFTVSQPASAVANGNARIYRGADRGLVLQGAPEGGGAYDLTIVNKNDTAVMSVNTGTATVRFFGTIQADFANILLNGNSTFPGLIGTTGVLYSDATRGATLAGFGGGAYDVSLANKTNGVALRVPTGTVNVEVVGTISASNLSGTNTGDQFTSLAANTIVANPTGSPAAAQAVTLAGGLTFSGTTLTLGAITPTSSAATGNITTSGGYLGFATGAGGTVVQATNKTTAVTLNKVCGQITTNNANIPTVSRVTFQVNNSFIQATDTILINLQSGQATEGTYRYWIEKVAANSFKVTVENLSAGGLAEALVFNYTAFHAVNA
jgi:hypothetical protein